MADGKMTDMVAEMAAGLTGIWMVTIVDGDGMVLVSWQAPDNKVSPEALGSFIHILNRTVTLAKQTPIGFSSMDDIIFSTTQLHQVIKPLVGGACFLIVSAPRSVPLGMIRMACTSFAPRLEQSLPGQEPLPRSNGMGTIVP
jgi:predicted regulator of Ras-like GTPase activity (Roadblock/LC7/MglB family)